MIHLKSLRTGYLGLARLLSALALLTCVARADTILVDAANGPGTDYTDLPQAVQAASHGDLILMRAGDYSSVTTAKGLRILGLESGVAISGPFVLQNLHSSRKFVMTRVELTEVEFRNCAGHVALSHVEAYYRLRAVTVEDCADVRLSDLFVVGREGQGQAVLINKSDVELVDCTIRGWTGPHGDWDYVGASGETGVLIGDASRVRISLCEIDGGTGTDVWTEFWLSSPGNGMPAVHVRGGSEVWITGDGTQTLQGGHCGWAGQFADTPGDGSVALFVEQASTVRRSGVICQGGWGPFTWEPEQVAVTGGTIEEPVVPDPTLEMIGDPIPGQVLTMRVTGPPGGNVRYLLGRIPELSYLGGVGPDLLVEIRLVNPGLIPASGVRDYDFVLPGNLPQGMYFLGQAKIVYDGSTYRTPSQVILAH